MRSRDGSGRQVSLFGHSVPVQAIQPRVVLLLLLSASFAGVWLSHWGEPVAVRLFWWTLVVAASGLAGGLYWWLALFDATAFDGADVARAVQRRWGRFEAVSVAVLTTCGLAAIGIDSVGVPDGPDGVVLVGGLLVAPVVWTALGRHPIETPERRVTAGRALLLCTALVTIGSFASVETGTGVLDWAVRVVHVGSFALWLGGAIWHNGVVLPTVRSRPAVAPTLKGQARLFRRHLPAVIVVLLATGAYQAVPLVGPSSLGSPLVALVGFKLVVLFALAGLVAVNVRKAASLDE